MGYLGADGEFDAAHVKLEMPVRHLGRDAGRQMCQDPELRREVWAEGTSLVLLHFHSVHLTLDMSPKGEF